MSLSPTFCVPPNTMREQTSACEILLASLDADTNRTLEDLLKVLQEGGYCRSCGPQAIIRLGIREGDVLPVPVLDVRDPGGEGWAALHGRFLAGNEPGRPCGHFVARNYASAVTDGFTREEFLEGAIEHETLHILQAMCGLHSDLMTPNEMALCKGHVGLLPALAHQRKMTRELAFDLAGRWFLQTLRGELQAWHIVDYPRVSQKAKEGKLSLDLWRRAALATMMRPLIRPVCGALLDTYHLSWLDLLASVRGRLEALLAGTFLEGPIPSRSGASTALSFLEGIRPRNGLLQNATADPETFAHLIMFMPRVGWVGVYDPEQGPAKRYLARRRPGVWA